MVQVEQRAVLTRPQTLDGPSKEERALFTFSLLNSWKPGQLKFFALCLMDDGTHTVLSARATSEAEASRKLHSGYKVQMVIDIRTEEQHNLERRKFQRSLITAPIYH